MMRGIETIPTVTTRPPGPYDRLLATVREWLGSMDFDAVTIGRAIAYAERKLEEP